MKMDRYKFLLFDADHTLLDFDGDMRSAFLDMYKECGLEKNVQCSDEIINLYEKINDGWWKKFELGLCSKNELYIGRFEEFLSKIGSKLAPGLVNQKYFESLSKYGTFYDGAKELLEKLYENHEIYIITNGNKLSQEKRLIKCGMMKFAKKVFVSEDVGFGKPDLRYFEHVFSEIPDFEKENAVVIGDSLSADIKGAENAELDSVWYNPKLFPNEMGIPVTFEAKSYDEIYSFICG